MLFSGIPAQLAIEVLYEFMIQGSTDKQLVRWEAGFGVPISKARQRHEEGFKCSKQHLGLIRRRIEVSLLFANEYLSYGLFPL